MIHAFPDAATTGMVIGHEPSMSGLSRRLSTAPVPTDCARAFQKFQTAAIAVFEAQSESWSQLSPGGARFAQFVTPKDLA